MHITSSFARRKPCHLLRESYWENGQVKKRTLANLSALPQPIIDLLRQALRNELPAADPQTAPIRVRASRQHGAVSAILSLVRLLGFDEVLFSKPSPARSRALAMIVWRLLARDSNLRVERELGPAGRTTLAALLDIRNASLDELCNTLDWLADRQAQIEHKLARRHLQVGSVALYTVFSTYVEGSRGPSATRDDQCPANPQIVYGLLHTRGGCPVAVQCFPDNVANPDEVAHQVARLRDRFGLERVDLVGGHDLFGETHINGDLQAVGFDRISVLARETIHELADREVMHLTEKQARAHVFLSMLAYYLEWHLRHRWAPLLFVPGDGIPPESPVGSADGKSSREELPMQSFPDLLESLGALAAVELEYTQVPSYAVPTLSELTPLQQRAFELLEAEPHPAPTLSDPSGTEAGN